MMKRTGRESARFLASLVLMLLTVLASPLAAQTVDPTTAEFTPSPDHNATLSDGSPVVQSYQIEFYLMGAASPFQTNSLGKPAPQADGMIRTNLAGLLVGWPVPGTQYVADVAAVGPGGSTRSALSNTFTFSAPCTFSASPTSASPAAAGGPASVSVTAGAGCAWTAVSTAAWITVTSGASGTGNGTVNYTVAANTGSARSGSLTVGGQTVTVNQGGSCSFGVSPTSASPAAAGGAASVSVTAGAGCAWT